MLGNSYIPDKSLLRFSTAGSVDVGKSTLIGRLLYDSKSIFEDQLEALERMSAHSGSHQLNLANLTDGLKAEREQGITIDVAYRYFATPKRRFIIADTPGHIQYTRNMVTGSTNANLAVMLIDARKGVTEQTKRHTFLASLLRVPHVVLAINKMDLVNYSEERFLEIVEEYKELLVKFPIRELTEIPMVALSGDNIVHFSENMSWYNGRTLLQHLEEVSIEQDRNLTDSRFPVQWIVRPLSDEFHDYRGLAGLVLGGVFRREESVTVYPSGNSTSIKDITTASGSIDTALNQMSVSLHINDDLDVSRGDMLVSTGSKPIVRRSLQAVICWMSETNLVLGRKYWIKHTSQLTRCVIRDINYKFDVNTGNKVQSPKTLELNDIGKASFEFTTPLVFDSFSRNRYTGSFIIIDEATNATVGAAMIS